ncbi:hypothetical protein F511_18697 [Dorcoceras hygrometricum]|uniref:Uncharacterized protein n=1 Tax=Dorcoceras hygrometricum TaxID=472368 RepID=A0A2Z7C2H4_9LAMI|nr:hypothetical protein F511_18697 [Dorcoceras hygrometricum]
MWETYPFVPYLLNPRTLFSRELFRRFPVVPVVVLARARLLPESSGFLAGLVIAQYKVRILSLYFSVERGLDELRDGCVGLPCLLLSWLRTVYAVGVFAVLHMFICLFSRCEGERQYRTLILPAGIVATMRRVVNYHSSWARQQQVGLFDASGNPGSTAGRGFNPAGGAPGGG